jgi:hypothetical protein
VPAGHAQAGDTGVEPDAGRMLRHFASVSATGER